MKSESTFLEILGAIVISFIADLLCYLWLAHIILQTIGWYNIRLQTNSSEIIGSLLIIALIRQRINPKDETKWHERVVYKIIGIGLSWGLIYLFHLFM